MANLKASIDFGLIHIPVEIVGAEDRTEHVSFHMFDSKDKSRIRLKRVNENTGKEVDWDDIIKGYELSNDKYVYFTQEELDALEEESNSSLAIDVFVDKSEIDPALYENPYLLKPSKGAEKGYAVLQKALESTGKYAVIQAVLRNREQLGVIYSRDGALGLEILRYPNEIKSVADVVPAGVRKIKVNSKELSMAERLMEEMEGKFVPKNYKDDYAVKLKSAIKRKSKSAQSRKKDDSGKKGRKTVKQTVDIMELLAESIKSRGKKRTQQRKRA